MPPEKVITVALRRSHSPTISSTWRMRSGDERGVDAVELGVQAQVLLGGRVAVERRVLEDEADVATDVVAIAHDVVAGDARAAARSGA